MTIFLRIVCCFLGLTFVGAAHAAPSDLVVSEQQLQASYEAAVALVKAQKPSLLPALEKEQEDWRKFRDEECKQVSTVEYCKANMNRKRARVLRGEHPSGKKQGTSF